MNTEQALLKLRESLAKPESVLTLTGLLGTSSAWLIARLLKSVNHPILWITPLQKEAEQVASDLSFFSDFPVLLYPCHDSLPFVPLLPSTETISQRISTLYRLSTEDGPAVVVAPAQALVELTVPPEILLNHVEYLQKGEEVDREKLLKWLIDSGYEHCAIVQSRGEFSIRGGLLDIFPPLTTLPVRIDFFADFVEEMRLFDPLTQRSTEDLNELVILPAHELIFSRSMLESIHEKLVERAAKYNLPARRVHEILQQLEARRLVEGHEALLPLFYPKPASVLDYIPQQTPLLIDRPEEVKRALENYWKGAEQTYESAINEHRIFSPLESLLSDPEQLSKQIRDHTCWLFQDINVYRSLPNSSITKSPNHQITKSKGSSFNLPASNIQELEIKSSKPDLTLMLGSAKRGIDLIGPVLDRLKDWIEAGERIVLVVPGRRQGQRMIELLSYHELISDEARPPILSAPLTNDPAEPGLMICTGQLTSGFALPGEAYIVLTEEELLGARAGRTRGPGREKTTVSDLTFEDLKPGQPIVHRDHGVGLYKGLVRIETGGVPGEFLFLEYRGGDKLYLPVDRLGLVQKYIGIEGRVLRLDRLGSSSWQLAKQKVKKDIYEIAHELVELYASRKVSKGFDFSPPDAMFRQFEASFPYEETRDQAASIEEVLSDMQEPRPMDRLLCGDVGYGKTEVAMRAVFKAVEDGKQVAILVPTTLLAEQHERTFIQRFQRYPVTVEALSRLKTRQKQREILAGISQGRVDILIGTHRLLQPDVKFKDLGLLIVDEEHRFGVKHKERLKRLKQTVDCLTLTATPIPRTLQLSLLGIRDLSTINTPPRDRIPVKTFMAEFDDSLIKEAIEREISRGGQVFFVHNRIKGLYRLAEHIQRLTPDARIEVIHGRMKPDELEEIMIRFVRGDIDCLMCTTIIESGIDIPSANTTIINRADKLGLADLYQLRGRVGRAGEQAYAYLLIPRISEMGKESIKRLKAIMELSVSGGGFRLAMQDLQIRGAGNILGVSQSGSIAEVGYELYLELLQKAIDEFKGLPQKDEIDPEVNLGIPAFIPEEYVPDVEQRLLLYRRMARLEDNEKDTDFSLELRDRFGPMPEEVASLLKVMGIKRTLRLLNVIRLDRNFSNKKERIVLGFGPEGPPHSEKLVEAVQKNRQWRLLPDGRLIISPEFVEKDGDSLASIRQTLQVLLKMATKG
ncbi:MAG: transcription-repair coupling factor [Deltaproteobacteria bacterium]|nr:transcription-repair coupling factor [Deltaproteobacteria bacterium]